MAEGHPPRNFSQPSNLDSMSRQTNLCQPNQRDSQREIKGLPKVAILQDFVRSGEGSLRASIDGHSGLKLQCTLDFIDKNSQRTNGFFPGVPRIFAIFEKINEKYLDESDFEGDEDSTSFKDAGSRGRVIGDEGKLHCKGSSYFGKAMDPIDEEELGVEIDLAEQQKKAIYYQERGPKWPSFQGPSAEKFSNIVSRNRSPQVGGSSEKKIPGDDAISIEIISDGDLFNRVDHAKSNHSFF